MGESYSDRQTHQYWIDKEADELLKDNSKKARMYFKRAYFYAVFPKNRSRK